MKSITEVLSHCTVVPRAAKFDKPCLLWQLSKNASGNGWVSFNGKTWNAHRLVFEHLVGPVPKDKKLRNLCDCNFCCEPSHWTYLPPSVEEIVGNCRPVWHDPDLEKPCLVWKGTTFPFGYGEIWYEGRPRLVHKIVFEALARPVPDGLELDHVCRNPPCCEPSHLEPVSHRENVLRGDGVAAKCARKTHCPKGHPYDEANTRIGPKGQRFCRKCHVANETERRRRKRAENPTLPRNACREKTHCPKGHPYVGDNLYTNPQGRRECRECGRIAVRAYRERKQSQLE